MTASGTLAQNYFQYNCGLKHPRDGRPELPRNRKEQMGLCLANSIWTVLRQPCTGFLAGETASLKVFDRLQILSGHSFPFPQGWEQICNESLKPCLANARFQPSSEHSEQRLRIRFPRQNERYPCAHVSPR